MRMDATSGELAELVELTEPAGTLSRLRNSNPVSLATRRMRGRFGPVDILFPVESGCRSTIDRPSDTESAGEGFRLKAISVARFPVVAKCYRLRVVRLRVGSRRRAASMRYRYRVFQCRKITERFEHDRVRIRAWGATGSSPCRHGWVAGQRTGRPNLRGRVRRVRFASGTIRVGWSDFFCSWQ